MWRWLEKMKWSWLPSFPPQVGVFPGLMEKLGFDVESQTWIWKLPLPLVNGEHFFPTPKFSILEWQPHCVSVRLFLALCIPFSPRTVEWSIWVVNMGKVAGTAQLTSDFHLLRSELGFRAQISSSAPSLYLREGCTCPGQATGEHVCQCHGFS